MKALLARLVAVALLLAVPAQAGEPAPADGPGAVFVAGFDDLPLMAPLRETAGAGIIFDTPQGRIVERYASGATDAAAVGRFYRDSLAALGWQAAGPLVFEREGERLTITIYPPDSAQRLTVRFSLAPS